MNQLFDPDPNMRVKPLPSKPTHNFMRDVNLNLDGEMLKKIHAGPKVIDFGQMFVKSIGEKFFFVRNDMKNAISARLVLDEDSIALSYEKPQILLSGQMAGFRVSFRSLTLGKVSQLVSYTLNEKHVFKFMIKANIVPVKLKLNIQRLDIKFSDDNLEMEAGENVQISNNGNANARFSWYSPCQSFSFVPSSGMVKPGTSLTCKVSYKPNGIKLYEEEQVDLRVEDG